MHSHCSKCSSSVNHFTFTETLIRFHIALTGIFSLHFKKLHLIRKLKKNCVWDHLFKNKYSHKYNVHSVGQILFFF